MRTTLRSIVVVLVLAGLSLVAFGQTQQQLPSNPSQFDPGVAVGPPTVVITEVRNLGASGNNLRILVKWNAQIPSTTRVEKFRVLLAVNYNSGAPALPNQDLPSSAREAILLVPDRGAGNPPKSFRTFIQSFFTTILVQNTTFGGGFKLNKGNGFVDGQKLTQGSTGVGKVGAANDGSDVSKIDVGWAFTPPSQPFGLKEVKFEIKGDFVYRGANGNQQALINRSATLAAGAGGRQVQFSFPATPKFQTGFSLVDIDANITVKAFFTITQRKESAPLEGTL
ncbi:MAG: hypothetical protein ABI882_08660 [Acidobacteriota bacterium]